MSFFRSVKIFFQEHFNLDEDKADETLIVETIKRDVQFKGPNLWALVFAIFIASIGLNVNSTAVIIGAMLISPLMGPIMGVGLGVAINDFDLLKKGINNLLIASAISILTSAVYFFITPIHDVNSELLARTNPSLWDVFIAFFGGLAGIVALMRKERTNVIPGVAIATALMPPLCTAGFGLATGKLYYFLGALYLYFINSLLICFATILMVKHLGFRKKEFSNKEKERRVTRSIWLIVIITIAPSIYLAYRIVQRSIFERNAKDFVQKEFHFQRTQVVGKNFIMEGKKKTIELLLIGQALKSPVIDSLRKRMPLYGLDSTKLVVHQGLDAKQEIDIAQIKASILEDVFKEETSTDSLPRTIDKLNRPIPDITREIKVLYPEITEYSLTNAVLVNVDSTRWDTVALFTAKTKKRLPDSQKKKLIMWVKQRIETDSLRLVNVLTAE
jgi:uncharacterized hydrophobic protein (TIGR00271 family)